MKQQLLKRKTQAENEVKDTSIASNTTPKQTHTKTGETTEETQTQQTTQGADHKKRYQKKSFADTASAPYKKVTKKNSFRFTVVFDVQVKIAGAQDGARQEIALKDTFSELIFEGQKIDPSFGLMTWKETKALPTIFDATAVDKMNYGMLINYLRAPMQGRALQTIKKGRNFKWQFNATFDMAPKELEAKWYRLSGKQFQVSEFPTQSEETWPIGFCMGSTENQVTTKLNEELENITNTPGI